MERLWSVHCVYVPRKCTWVYVCKWDSFIFPPSQAATSFSCPLGVFRQPAAWNGAFSSLPCPLSSPPVFRMDLTLGPHSLGPCNQGSQSPQSLGRHPWGSSHSGAAPPAVFSLPWCYPAHLRCCWGQPLGPCCFRYDYGWHCTHAPVSLTSSLFWSTEVCWVSFGPCHVSKNKCNNMHLKRLACLDSLISFWFYRDRWGF